MDCLATEDVQCCVVQPAFVLNKQTVVYSTCLVEVFFTCVYCFRKLMLAAS